jgi:cell division septation protein DedD
LARAFRFTSLDSAIWRSSHVAPAVDRVLAFDMENGLLAFADTSGAPGWLDLRIGSVRRPAKGTFASLASADGWSIYGTTTSGSLVRMTPSGDWQSPMSSPVLRVLPGLDGNVLLVTGRSPTEGVLYRIRPPDDAVADSMALGLVERAAITPVGDRAYVSVGDQVWSIPPADLATAEAFGAPDEVLALAPTPSGDRVFIAHTDSPRLHRLDRYARTVSASTRLPGLATELRMDPLGRYLLIRPVAGDSAWVVDVGSEELVGTVATAWRPDLPVVAVDGTVVALQGPDVVFVLPRNGRETLRVDGGAGDLWFFARWNGFRPRARGIDQPVAFRSGEIAAVPPSPADVPPAPAATAEAPAAAPPATAGPPDITRDAEPARQARSRWVLSFAAVLSAERAQALVEQIAVNGERPRISSTSADGTTVYRVIMGPFSSRKDAERAGRSSGHTFWVYESGGGT